MTTSQATATLTKNGTNLALTPGGTTGVAPGASGVLSMVQIHRNK